MDGDDHEVRAVGHLVAGTLRASTVQLAAALHMSQRTLLRWAHSASQQSSRWLISLSAITHAVWLVREVGLPSKRVAHTMGFTSVQAFSHFTARLTGMPPRALAESVGYAHLTDLLMERLGATVSSSQDRALRA